MRCAHGAPACLKTAPILRDGTPFPTRYWLTCPTLVKEVAAIESVPGWATGRTGPYSNCLHREVAAVMGGGGPTGEVVRRVLDSAHCRHRHLCLTDGIPGAASREAPGIEKAE